MASTSPLWHANCGLGTRAATAQRTSLFFGMPSLRTGRCIAGSRRRLRLPLSSQYSVPKAQRSAAPLVPSGRAASPALDVIFLDRSVFIDKEVITRTSGKRLGYINEMYVDPQNLQVVSFYLRQELLLSLGRAESDSSHFHLRNLMQVGDVVLVHDEQVLMEPPADEYVGFVRLVGARVRTENGNVLGKVRDFVFDPDNGQISSILYDPLGVPKIPQKLVTTYSLGWQNIKAVGPSEVIVFSGSEARAVKENEGAMTSAMEALVGLLGIGTSWSEGGGASAAAGGGAPMDPYARLEDPSYRASEEYRVWYQQYGAQYEAWSGKPLPPPPGRAPQAATQQVRRTAPRALPPPQSQAFNQALQPQQQPQQQAAGQGQPWQLVQDTREAVPAGWGGSQPPQQQQQRGQAGRMPVQPPQQQWGGWQQQQQAQQAQQQGAADVVFPVAPQQARQPPQQQPPSRPPTGGAPRAPQTAATYTQQPTSPGPYAPRAPPPQQQVPPQQQQWAGNPARAVEPDAVIQGGSGAAGRAPQQPAEFRSVPGAGAGPQAPMAGAQGMQGPGPAPGVPQQAPQQFRAQQPPQAPQGYQQPPPQQQQQ